MIIPVVFLQQLGFIRNKTITLHSDPYLSLHRRFTNISVSQSPKMTSQKERASRSSFWGPCSVWTKPSYKVSVYIWTHLIEGLHLVYTFGASPVAALQTFTSSGLNSALEDPKSDVALVFLPYSTRSLSIGVNHREWLRACMVRELVDTKKLNNRIDHLTRRVADGALLAQSVWLSYTH